jgi:TRAP transporter TAXI family solute receptor
MKKFLPVFFTVAFSFFVFAASPSHGEYQIIHAGTVTTSGNYTWGVAIGEAISKYADGVSCKTRAVGAGGLTLPMMARGQANMASALGLNLVQEAYEGIETFKKLGPNKKLRLFVIREKVYYPMWVTVSSGIKNFMDLKGKKINSGNPGSVAQRSAFAMAKALKTGVIWTKGSTSQAKNDVMDRRIDGYWRSAPAIPPGPNLKLKFDASALEINSTIPMTVCGFTEAQKNKVKAMFPQFPFGKIPAGGFQERPDMPAFWLTITPTGSAVSADIPQDVQYKMVKAVVEHWKEVGDAYPPSRPWDPLKDTLDLEEFGVPLCAGLVQYAMEKGLKVPQNLIPPEFKK